MHTEQTSTVGSSVEILRSRLLQTAGVVHGFSTRLGGCSRVYRPHEPGGDLNLGFTAADDAAAVRENRRRFLAALDTPSLQRFAMLRQEHTTTTHVLRQPDLLAADFGAPGVLRGDGLLTDLEDVLLAIGTADCMPVLVLDPVRRAIGAFHAGWRGTLAGIVQLGVAAMAREYGSLPHELVAAVGPGIGPASYVVSNDVRQQFFSNFDYADALFRETTTGPPSLYLDLWEANRRQLLDAGMPAGAIDVLRRDTAAETDVFFSHRAEKGHTGRMLSVIALTSGPR